MARKTDAVSVDTNVRLENARACCRRARKALVELSQSESVTSSHDAVDAVIKDLRGLLYDGLPGVHLRDNQASMLFAVKTEDHKMNPGNESELTDSILVFRRMDPAPEIRAQGHRFYGRPSAS